MADPVTETGGSFLGGLIGSPFRAIAGLFSGVWNSLWNGALLTAAIAGTQLFLPEVWRAGRKAIGGQQALDKVAKDIHERGVPGLVWDSAKLGFGIAGAVGGAKGMWDGATSGQEGAGKAGSVIGGGVVMVGAALVTIGALMKENDTKPAGSIDNSAKAPGTTPVVSKAAEGRLKE